MMRENIVTNTFKFVTFNVVGDFLYFPIWWYSVGLQARFKFLVKQIRAANRRSALLLWLKNMFVPMYGYYDLTSRAISLVMRLVLLVFKMAVFLIWFVFHLSVFFIYFLLPPAIIFMITRSF
ncbi:MAG TPA: hypothetical protein PLH37_02200 [bacterium]|nr:hypothetical protein [bacterium]